MELANSQSQRRNMSSSIIKACTFAVTNPIDFLFISYISRENVGIVFSTLVFNRQLYIVHPICSQASMHLPWLEPFVSPRAIALPCPSTPPRCPPRTPCPLRSREHLLEVEPKVVQQLAPLPVPVLDLSNNRRVERIQEREVGDGQEMHVHAKQRQAAHEPDGEDDVGDLLDLGLRGKRLLGAADRGFVLLLWAPWWARGGQRGQRGTRRWRARHPSRWHARST